MRENFINKKFNDIDLEYGIYVLSVIFLAIFHECVDVI